MILVGAVGARVGDAKRIWLRTWTITGCVGSAVALAGLSLASATGPGWPLAANVMALGFFNGMFAVAAIGSMMGLAGEGEGRQEGLRMGLWGAAQAIAFASGGFLGAAGVDALRALLADTPTAFLVVFALEGLLFLAAATLAARLDPAAAQPRASTAFPPRLEASP
jgi:BCD family chlorophyll transporter-like MFS transporter